MKSFFRKLINTITLLPSKSARRHGLVGPPNLWKMKRDFQIRFLIDNGLKPEHFLLDLGCGTLRGGIPLIDYLQEGHYWGIEARAAVLEEGKKELEEAGLKWKKPSLLTLEAFSKTDTLSKFDVIWAFSVLIHMNDDVLFRTIDIVKEHLADNGVFYANVNIGERSEGNWQGFPVVWRSLDFYRHACSRYGLLVDDLGTLKELGHNSGIKDQDNQRMLKIAK